MDTYNFPLQSIALNDYALKECLEYGAITHDLPINFLKDILISIEGVNSKKLGYYRFSDSNEKNILIG
jgi:hypothetical protein